MSRETYSNLWAVYVHNGGECGFYVNVWYDHANRAEAAVRRRYPDASIIYASCV